MRNPNKILFLKSKLLLVKIEHNESISSYLFRVKELNDKLGYIGEKVSSNDMVIVTLNGMLLEYQVFITSILAIENVPSFDHLACILMKEEERRIFFERIHDSLDLVLMVKGKKTFQRNPFIENKGGRLESKSQQGGTS